jgi:four helix bundle protein
MATITCFEDLIAWQKARVLTREIYQATGRGSFAKDFELRGQIRDAAVSTMSNIAEGFERRSPGEFSQFLNIAKASCAELRSELYVALDARHLVQHDFDDLQRKAQEVGRLIAGLKMHVDSRKQPVRRRGSSKLDPRTGAFGDGNSELGTRNSELQ